VWSALVTVGGVFSLDNEVYIIEASAHPLILSHSLPRLSPALSIISSRSQTHSSVTPSGFLQINLQNGSFVEGATSSPIAQLLTRVNLSGSGRRRRL